LLGFYGMMKLTHAFPLLVVLFLGCGSSDTQTQNAPEDECVRIAHSQIYSNAFLSNETGDVLGLELVLDEGRNDSAVQALLYLYEGAPNKDGSHISGNISGKKLMLKGALVEHPIEYPSKKEIVEARSVSIDGTLDSTSFRGNVRIEVMKPMSVRLNRVDNIWLCKH
jgi:hypothetical protein